MISAAAVTLALTFGVHAPARERPTFRESHVATHLVLERYADLMGGHLVVGPCRKAGVFSTVCRARIDGPSSMRYRLLITRDPDGGYLVSAWTR